VHQSFSAHIPTHPTALSTETVESIIASVQFKDKQNTANRMSAYRNTITARTYAD